MGIRYYAYAFEPQATQQAVDDPASVTGADPLADAWGLEPGSAFSVATFEPRLPRRDLLYLDKAWSLLQRLTEPSWNQPARPAYRMFEGGVTEVPGTYGWLAWHRTLTPSEVVPIALDLELVTEEEVRALLDRCCFDDEDRREQERAYLSHFLGQAKDFVRAASQDGRGFVYTIG